MLENIDIIEYKCFKEFKLNDFKRINIISGGNNVGKTALLEAFYIAYSTNDLLDDISTIAKNRNSSKENFIHFVKKFNYKLSSNLYALAFEVKTKYKLNEKEKIEVKKLNADYNDFVCMSVDDDITIEPLEKVKMADSDNLYINSSKPDNHLLVKLYSEVQTKGIQHKFLEYLRILDKDIAWIEPQLIDGELLLRINLNNPEHSLISSELGEGVNRYIEILAVLLSNSNGSVFIDEIENGIHYSKLKDICKAVIEIAQKEDIQLFLTTHDKETIEAFSEVSEELDFKDICSIELYKEDNVIKSIIRNDEQFRVTVEAGMDIR